MHEWLNTLLELYICAILTAEYFYGRSDADIKREEKRKQAKRKLNFETLNQGEGK